MKTACSCVLLALAIGAAVPACAFDRVLDTPRIEENGDVPPSDAVGIGRSRGGTDRATPDGLATQGPGSTGDLSGMSVRGAGSRMRTLADRIGETPSVLDYGADPSGTADSTAAFTTALASGKPITAPCGVFRLGSMVSVTVRADFRGSGSCTTLTFDAAAGSPVTPMLNVLPGAAGTIMRGFTFDHQANTKNFAPGRMYDGLVGGVAFLVQADNTTVSDVTGRNGYDNCLMVARMNGAKTVTGMPQYYTLDNIRTFSCGGGKMHTGAGVDIGSGSRGTVNGLVDTGSYAAFILDIGAGAQGSFSNLTGIGTRFDATVPSFTFYIGTGDSTFTNLTSIDAQDHGLWLDKFAFNTTLTNVLIKAPKGVGARIRASRATVANLIVNSPGYGAASPKDAVQIDTSAGPIDALTFVSPVVMSEFAVPRTGFAYVGTNPAAGSVIGGDLQAAAVPHTLPDTFAVVDTRSLGAQWRTYTPAVTCASGAPVVGVSSGRYRVVGKTVDLQVTVRITRVGTCAGAVRASIPKPPAADAAFSGQESATAGYALTAMAYAGDGVLQIKKYDGATPAVAGHALSVGGTYQSQ